MSSFFLSKRGVQILCLFNQNQTPRSDSANLEPSKHIFCPPNSGAQVILELPTVSPEQCRDRTAQINRAARRFATAAAPMVRTLVQERGMPAAARA